MPLEQYKGQYYTYKPSDFYTNFKIGITDSTFVDYTGEGPIANKIISFKKINKATYYFKMTGAYNKTRFLKVYVVDEIKGVAIFEDNTKGLGIKYYLMINAAKIKQFPIVVNYSENTKQKEFIFDSFDFKKYVKK